MTIHFNFKLIVIPLLITIVVFSIQFSSNATPYEMTGGM